MQLSNINCESDLRQWLTDSVEFCEGRLKLNWIEPSMYGSSVGQPDVEISYAGQKIGLELKYLLTTRKGIKWEVRPAQRRYHHMNVKKGGRSALMAYIPAATIILLVRGDHIPLRDYAADPSSGCPNGQVIMEDLSFFSIDRDRQTVFNLENMLYHSNFWEKNYAQTAATGYS